MIDYIIVGAGLSGIAVAQELLKAGKKIKVYENHSQASSTVAGGIYNPVILKRFTLAWNADKQLEIAIPFYKELEEKLNISLVAEMPIYRRFNSIEEQNNWFEAADKPSISKFLDPKLVPSINPCIPSDHSFGKVNHTGIINTELLLTYFRHYLQTFGALEAEEFQHDILHLREDGCEYKGVHAKAVIFCEGYGMKGNPYFNCLPLHGNKGEYIIIKAEDLKLEVAVKSSVFILPLGNDHYKVGATYDNKDTSPQPTDSSKEYLLKKLEAFLKCDFKVVNQVAGIRPATPDRKPLVGKHPEYSNIYCCNGFGSRGVLIAPTIAKQLVGNLINDESIPEEINISRYHSFFPSLSS